ncbi:MAG: redoxin domain-containing protein [Gemmatimonadaceae bacterium]
MTEIEAPRVPAVGESAPDVTLQATNGQQVTLSSFRGSQNVLLAFFPLAFTSTCTSEMCAFRDDFNEFVGKNVVVFPVSVDATPSLIEFKKKYDVPLEMLSDFTREAANKYGVLIPDRFFTKRAYFLIDKEGIIRWVHVEAVNAHRRENSEILAEIAKLG